MRLTPFEQTANTASYGPSLREHFGPELRRQIRRSQQIDMNSQQRFQFVLQATQVEQRRTGQSINQQIEVTAVSVGTMYNRTEDARISCPIPARTPPSSDANPCRS